MKDEALFSSMQHTYTYTFMTRNNSFLCCLYNSYCPTMKTKYDHCYKDCTINYSKIQKLRNQQHYISICSRDEEGRGEAGNGLTRSSLIVCVCIYIYISIQLLKKCRCSGTFLNKSKDWSDGTTCTGGKTGQISLKTLIQFPVYK